MEREGAFASGPSKSRLWLSVVSINKASKNDTGRYDDFVRFCILGGHKLKINREHVEHISIPKGVCIVFTLLCGFS